MRRSKFKPVGFGLLLIILLSLFSWQVIGATIDTPTIAKMDVFGADIREVFRSLGELGNLSVLLDPDVKGSVTVGLKAGLTVQEAVELLAQTNGYSYRWLPSNRTVIIGNEKTFVNFGTQETRVYQFHYAQTDQLVDALKNIVSAEKIGVDKRTNQLTITASVLQHQNIADIVKRLDREMPQITIEIRVEEIQKSAMDSVGTLWTMGGNGATSDDIQLDFSKPTATVNLIHSLQLWEQTNQAKLLSNPKIATTDSQEGSIFIGDKYPVVTTSESNGTVTYNITYIDMGTKLAVTPRINENDIVTVNVKANVSSFSEWAQVGDNNKVPVVRNRDLSSVIRLRDGETFVLSGLSEIRSVETTSGIKGLGKIPLIGWLFKNKTTDPQKDTEVCIFITPKIIRMNSETGDNKSDNKTAQMQVDNNKPESKVPLNEQKTTAQTNLAVKDSTPAANDKSSQEQNVEQVPEQPTANANNSQQSIETTGQNADNATTESSVESVSAPEPKMQTANSSTEKTTVDNKEDSTSVKYIVKSSDSLGAIAKKFGVNANEIIKKNSLPANSKLAAGKTLNIPIPKNHVYYIKPKETLWRIAKRYGVTIQVLQEINRISDMTKVESGQRIILPLAVDQIANSVY